jgi:hypothetical protein
MKRVQSPEEWQELLDETMARIKESAVPDPTPEERAEREAAERRERAADEEWRRRLQLTERGVPVKDHDRIVSGVMDATPAMVAARAFLSDARVRILVLIGGKGCGKTTAAGWVIAQPCPDRYMDPSVKPSDNRQTFWPPALAPRFVDVAFLARQSRYSDEQMRPLERCSMLAIDDLGMEFNDEKGSFKALLDGLMNARYATNLRTVITTNLHWKDFPGRYGERLVDRILEVGKLVGLTDKSLRGRPGGS